MSAAHGTLTLRTEVGESGEIRLLAPDTGEFTGALAAGATLAPGMRAGALRQLGRSWDLIVPAGVGGAIVSAPPRALVAPVGFADVLYRLDPEGAPSVEIPDARQALGLEGDEAAVLSNQSGRVWHRPSPDAAPFCAPGDLLTDGSPLCLMEVMKTFSTVPYRPAAGLPERARVVRWLVDDGGDIEPGAPLLSVEPA